MVESRVVSDFIIQSIFVIGVSFAMIRVGQRTGTRFLSLDIPYAGRIGFVVGATLTLSVFVVLRWGYETYQTSQTS